MKLISKHLPFRRLVDICWMKDGTHYTGVLGTWELPANFSHITLISDSILKFFHQQRERRGYVVFSQRLFILLPRKINTILTLGDLCFLEVPENWWWNMRWTCKHKGTLFSSFLPFLLVLPFDSTQRKLSVWIYSSFS